MSDKDYFYLDKVFPEPENIFSFEYKSIEQIEKDCIFVFDTNVFFVPFDSSEKSIEEINKILKKLKKENKLFIPARVAREFANNRAKKIGDLFLKVRQTKENLNSGPYKFEDYPLLEDNENYKLIKSKFENIVNLIKESRNLLTNIENDIKNWNWNDNVSAMYKEIFTKDNIVELKKNQTDLIEDLQNRIQYKIAPGYKDSGKIDDGIGDLIIWTTILELAKDKKSDIIFVSNDQKNDWFYNQDKIGLYPKYELFDEFRRFTDEKSIHIINFPKFLEIRNAKVETIKEVRITIAKNDENQRLYNFSRDYKHSDLSIGTILYHRKFGRGEILDLYHSGKGKEWVQIQFDSGLNKKLILKTSDLYVPKTPSNIIKHLFKFNFENKKFDSGIQTLFNYSEKQNEQEEDDEENENEI
ncbi:PIN domain-containing protein [Epilithonimonas sp.]|uniref:PIN domain-containing protein n=1 Tax=Epilithonimonas sp. TaxID=2894511 RepID=UPI0035B471A7